MVSFHVVLATLTYWWLYAAGSLYFLGVFRFLPVYRIIANHIIVVCELFIHAGTRESLILQVTLWPTCRFM